jgi:hypothetical protein
MAGNQVSYGAKNRESGLSALSLRPCEPLALISVNGQEPEIGGSNFWIENGCSTRPWGRQALISLNGSCLLVVYLGHSASVFGDLAVYLRI